jgi:hypothetical protein
MLQLKDQIDSYILKYKEELFKNSSNSSKNQEIIQDLRNYFETASLSGEYELQKSLHRLMSPQALARKHLHENGIKVSKRRGFLSYAFFLSLFLLTLVLVFIFALFYYVFPYFESSFEGDVVTWEIKYGDTLGLGREIETFQGNINITTENRLYIEAKALNAEFKTVDQDFIFYKCEYVKEEAPVSDFYVKSAEQISISLIGKPTPRKCSFEIPSTITLAVEAEAVNIEVAHWNHDLQIKSNAGNITLNLDSSVAYDLNVFVEQGNLQGLSNFNSVPNGKKIEVYLQQGNVVLTPY